MTGGGRWGGGQRLRLFGACGILPPGVEGGRLLCPFRLLWTGRLLCRRHLIRDAGAVWVCGSFVGFGPGGGGDFATGGFVEADGSGARLGLWHWLGLGARLGLHLSRGLAGGLGLAWLGAGELLDIFWDLSGSEDGLAIRGGPAADVGEEASEQVELFRELAAALWGGAATDGEEEEVEDIGEIEIAALEGADDVGQVGAKAGVLREAGGEIAEVLPLACGIGVEATDRSDLVELIEPIVEALRVFVDFGTWEHREPVRNEMASRLV